MDDSSDAAAVGDAGPTATMALPREARSQRRQRRPSGAPPPLPRKLGTSGKIWLAVGAVALANIVWVPFVGQPRTMARLETAVLADIAGLRAGWLTTILDGLNTSGSRWAPTVLGWATIVVLAALRRWRHLFVFLASIAVLGVVGGVIYGNVARARPVGVDIIGHWGGFTMPSPPVAALTTILLGMAYSLVVAGRPRQLAKLGVVVVMGTFAVARLYLGVDHPSDIVYGIVLGVAIPLLAFRLFAPNEVFPVAYRKGKKAHLDVTGERGDAIRRAIEEQLGLTVIDVEPVGLAGSGGSTPLRLCLAGEPDTAVFAKLYARSHLRADRWYKLGRTILYGALEDEAPFHTVRRLVEYEDYTLRVLRDVGIPTAAPYGVVEITPEQEYLLVTSFIEGAREIGDAEVDEAVIDAGLAMVRKLWDAGLAHRDIKPANLLVRDSEVYLIDPFFVQVRPSPWRQAVDLANMMLVLAVRSDPDVVYRRALELFTPDEIAEAFAATRGVASPTQLRAAVKRDGRDLLAHFRRLAPDRRPIAIQRWNARRILLTGAALVASFFAFQQTVQFLAPVQELPIERSPECGTGSTLRLMAQAVPSASAVPCIQLLPAGWSFDVANIRDGRARFSLQSDRAGGRAVVVTLTERCDLSTAREISRDENMTRFEHAVAAEPRPPLVRSYVFPGGCVTYRFSPKAASFATQVIEAESGLTFVPRTDLVEHVQGDVGLSLCGRDAPPCPP